MTDLRINPRRQNGGQFGAAMTAGRSHSSVIDRVDLSLAAAFAGLIYLAGPIIGTINNGLGDALLTGAAAITAVVVPFRMNRRPALFAWVLIYCAVYAVASFSTANTELGLRHAVTAGTAAGAMLLFATYGTDLVADRWFRFCAYALAGTGAAVAGASTLPKNIQGGIVIYSLALLVTVALTRARRGSWLLILAFLVLTPILALVLDFRGMLGYAAILFIALIAATALPKPVYWVLGVVVSVSVVGTTIWYFLNVRTNAFAAEITRLVVDASGRPATSGRDWLWPNIIKAVQDSNPWFGLGPATLPRDIMPTTFSSHNYYLQVYLQLGIAGLALLVFVLLAIWAPLSRGTQLASIFGSAVFLMFVAHNSTEVLMFQNGLLAAVPAWCAVGLALAFAPLGRESGGPFGKSPRKGSFRGRSRRDLLGALA